MRSKFIFVLFKTAVPGSGGSLRPRAALHKKCRKNKTKQNIIVKSNNQELIWEHSCEKASLHANKCLNSPGICCAKITLARNDLDIVLGDVAALLLNKCGINSNGQKLSSPGPVKFIVSAFGDHEHVDVAPWSLITQPDSTRIFQWHDKWTQPKGSTAL